MRAVVCASVLAALSFSLLIELCLIRISKNIEDGAERVSYTIAHACKPEVK